MVTSGYLMTKTNLILTSVLISRFGKSNLRQLLTTPILKRMNQTVIGEKGQTTLTYTDIDTYGFYDDDFEYVEYEEEEILVFTLNAEGSAVVDLDVEYAETMVTDDDEVIVDVIGEDDDELLPAAIDPETTCTKTLN